MKKLLCTCTLLTMLNGCMGGDNKQQIPQGPSLITLNSGLKYTILQEAPQNSPQARQGKEVTVHYTGWIDQDGQPGAKFDSSVDRHQPFTFILGVGQVIRGWDEGVVGMKVGEKRRLIIPAELGYGSRGAGRLIPPYATLIFDVELLSV